MKGRLLAAAALGILVVAAGACGGGGKKAYANISRADYASELNQICASADAKVKGLGSLGTIGDIKAKGSKLEDIYDEAVDNFGKITPPADEKDTANQFVDMTRQLLSKVKDLVDAAKAGDQAKYEQIGGEISQLDSKTDDVARQLGANVCAKPGG